MSMTVRDTVSAVGIYKVFNRTFAQDWTLDSVGYEFQVLHTAQWADGREKFGTYTRDNPGQDYADQRYYGVGKGRFNVPDPATGSYAADPSSWNKYAYVGGPIESVGGNV